MNMSRAALEYLKEGKSIFPVQDKKPLVLWKSFQTTLPSEEQVVKWWTQWPEAGIGMATGKLSNILVVDCDSHEAAMAFRKRYPEAEQTARVKTSKGQHIYFQYIDGIYNSAGKLGPGLDIRGEGGYVVMPPSVHASGIRYQWGHNRVILPASEALAVLLRATDLVYEGQRNDTMFRYGAKLRSQGFEEEAILTSLASENSKRCKPPLWDKELRAILKSIIRYPAGTRDEDIQRVILVGDPDLLATPSPTYLWGSFLTTNGTGLIVGQPGAGKSLFSRSLAYAVATGEPFLGYPVVKGVAIYLSLEESQQQVADWRRKCGECKVPNLLTTYGQYNIEDMEWAIREKKAKLLIVDILGKFFDIYDINKDYTIIARQLRNATHIAHKYDCCILFCHHASWAQDNRPLGSTALAGGPDHELTITGRQEREYRIVQTTKQRSGLPLLPLAYCQKSDGRLTFFDIDAKKVDENRDRAIEIKLANPGISKRKFRIEMKGIRNVIADKLYDTVSATVITNENNELGSQNTPCPDPYPPSPGHTKEERTKEETDKTERARLSKVTEILNIFPGAKVIEVIRKEGD